MKVRCLLYFIAAVAWSYTLTAEIKLPEIFSDGMVFQRDMPVKIWGTADANSQVDVEFAGKKFVIHILNSGKKEWDKVQVQEAFCDGEKLPVETNSEKENSEARKTQACLRRVKIEKMSSDLVHKINVILN